MQSTEGFEKLRRILESQESHPVTIEDAVSIGESLLEFFTVLGNEAQGDE
jgi:hypothetical protein